MRWNRHPRNATYLASPGPLGPLALPCDLFAGGRPPMTLFHLRGPVSPAFPGAVTPFTPSRVAEPDPPWDLPPPKGVADSPAANGQHTTDPRFSDRLIEAAERVLDLPTDPRSPQPPEAAQRTQQALHEAALALDGVDYLTQLAFSAVHRGPGFRAAAQALGLSPHAVDPATRAQIDARMGQRFAQAAAAGSAPVDRHTAAQWLHHELFILTC